MNKLILLSFFCAVMTSCSEGKENLDTSKAIEEKVVSDNDNHIQTAPQETLPEGEFVSKYPNGVIKAEGTVLNGKRSGLWTAYHSNGNKQSENEYKAGVLFGKTVVYHANGQVMYIGYYKNGQYEGKWIYFTKDGEELKSISFKNGKEI